jgi:hypothetical protein
MNIPSRSAPYGSRTKAADCVDPPMAGIGMISWIGLA